VRITDTKVLDVPMDLVQGTVKPPSGVSGTGTVFAINHNADDALVTLRYKLKDADIQMAEEPFDADGHHFNRGSFVIRGVSEADLSAAVTDVGLQAYALSAAPSVKTHPARAARVAILHNWTSTQTEGWWRQAFDFNGVPYDYIDPETIFKTADLRSQYDVIIAGPGLSIQNIDGTAQYGNPVPWKNSPETPNVGTWAQTDDIRVGMQLEGLIHIRDFINQGGVFITAASSDEFLTGSGLVRGVTLARPGQDSRVVGSLLRTQVADAASPIMYGVPDNLAVYSDRGEWLNAGGGGRGGRGGGGGGFGGGGGRGGGPGARATGRGTPDDPDVIQGRPANEASDAANAAVGDEAAGGRGGGRGGAVPPEMRPRTVLRFSTEDKLLVSGLLQGGADIAGQSVVVDVPQGKGHYVMFANNPIYRGETIGSYFMVYNALLSFDSLGAGR
jgi:hypothetical protein